MDAMGTRILCLLFLSVTWLCSDEKYNGPIPPKPDLPYLLEAKKLIDVEIGQAREEHRKDETVYVISGPASSARTPLPEPIFIIDARHIEPQQIQLYRLEVKDSNREAALPGKAGKGSAQPLHLRVTPIGERLYKIEASEMLEEGEYALTPVGDNRVFCFEVY
jgi:hypothetical protein